MVMRILRKTLSISAVVILTIVFFTCLKAASLLAAEPNEKELLSKIGVNRGIVVLLGEETASLAVDLVRQSELTLYVQSRDNANVSAARKIIDKAGLLGTRIYVERGDYSRIHLADNIADAIILIGSAAGKNQIRQVELERVLHSGGKVIAGKNVTTIANREGAGEWSHPYHAPDNNPQSDDLIAKAPFLTQFLAEPYYGPMPAVTVTANGRIFKAFGHISFKKREWPMLSKLIAINGYNGTMLWSRELVPGFMIHRNTMIATDDTLYLADNKSCKLIDAATGKVKDEIVIPKGLADGKAWKWMALQDGVLYALIGKDDLIDEVLKGTRTKPGWPWSSLGKAYADKNYPWGFGRTLIAFDPKTKQVLWKHQEKEQIDSRALCMNNDHIFIYAHQKFLAALYSENGKTIWKTSDAKLMKAIGEHDKAQTPRLGYSSQTYAKCNDKALYFAGPQRKKLVAVSAEDGKLIWDYPAGNFQLVIRDNALYAMGRTDDSKKFDLLTGKVLADLECFRGNCTRVTGTVDSIFARGHTHAGTLQLTVSDDQPKRIPGMRPACQDGVIAANGLLYWGPWMCDCNHSLVGVISLGPAGDFDFEQPADVDRLEPGQGDPTTVADFSITTNDWPTYRASNVRTASTAIEVPTDIHPGWTHVPNTDVEPTAPVTAGGLVFVAGSDGVVQAIDVATGKNRWTAYTGGSVTYPPSLWKGRVYVGSADGWVYAFEAATGKQLWRFRAAPVERKIPVYGRLSSNWPVASGVLVDDGIAYAAAGIISHDGTHVYALDAVTGKIKWQNNTSGRLISKDSVGGVSVQGHMLLHDKKLYLAGGNVASPAIYETATGKCLNTIEDEWTQKSPRGSELFLVEGEVAVADRFLYSPRKYMPSRYHAKYLLQASVGDVIIQGTDRLMVRVEPNGGPEGKPRVIWKDTRFAITDGVVMCKNAVVVLGRIRGETDDDPPIPVLTGLNPIDGTTMFQERLPVPPVRWGIAVNRDGRIIVTLSDGRVVCYEG